jgi:hypothetical protein
MKNERCYYSSNVHEALDQVKDNNKEYCERKKVYKSPVKVYKPTFVTDLTEKDVHKKPPSQRQAGPLQRRAA